ncbi:MAG: hydantoin utilization protein A [Cyanobacteria bacterium M_surface_10_m2_179]|nr:hydantoin utilization protein A [Cyanobacteria bacterium M_surface_10_m2_179]
MFQRLMPAGAVLALLMAGPALAHHPMQAMHLEPNALTGLISGLAHPLLGPDHLLFLLALALVGLQRSARWMVALLAVGLGGTALGLVLPAWPAAELLVSLTLVLEGLVVCRRLPQLLLVPAFALHGYALSSSVIGWEATPISTYLLGLLISQALLLLVSLVGLRQVSARLDGSVRNLLAGALIGVGAAFSWTALVG